MKRFLWGAITLILAIAIVGFWYLKTGRLDTRALGNTPSTMESVIASAALDASIMRRAPTISDPVLPTTATLTTGAQLYSAHCSACHGTPAVPESMLAHGLYPPVPQFFQRPPDMPANENFFVVKYGVRWTGMPGWGRALSDQQIWTLATFLSQIGKLPPAVTQTANGAAPATP